MNYRNFVALSALSAISMAVMFANPVFAQRGGKGGGNRGGDGGSRQRSGGGGGERGQGGQRVTREATRTDGNQRWSGNQDGRNSVNANNDWQRGQNDGNRWTQSNQSGANGRNWSGPNSNQWTRGDYRNYPGGYYGYPGGYYGGFYGGYPGSYYGNGFGLGLGLGFGLGRLGIPGLGLGYGGYGYGGYGGYGYGGYGPYTTYSNGYSSSQYADTSAATNAQVYVSTPGSSNEFLEAAKSAFLAGDYANAQRSANHAVIDSAQDPKTHEMMSLALFAVGEFRGAAVAAHTAAELGQVADWPTLYRYYRNRDTYVQHLEKLKEFVKEHPDVPEGRFLLGFHNQVLGHNEHAQKHYAEYLKQAPNEDPVAVKLFSSVGGDARTLPKREPSVPVKVPDTTPPAGT